MLPYDRRLNFAKQWLALPQTCSIARMIVLVKKSIDELIINNADVCEFLVGVGDARGCVCRHGQNEPRHSGSCIFAPRQEREEHARVLESSLRSCHAYLERDGGSRACAIPPVTSRSNVRANGNRRCVWQSRSLQCPTMRFIRFCFIGHCKAPSNINSNGIFHWGIPNNGWSIFFSICYRGKQFD